MTQPKTSKTLNRRKYGSAQAEKVFKDALGASGEAVAVKQNALALYRAARVSFGLGSQNHSAAVIRTLAQVIDINKVNRKSIISKVGGSYSVISDAYRRICGLLEIEDRSPEQLSKIPKKYLLSWIGARVGCVPRTCMEPHLADHLPSPGPVQDRLLHGLKHEQLKLNYGLAVILAYSRGNSRSAIQKIGHTFRVFDGVLTRLRHETEDPSASENLDAELLYKAISVILNDEGYSLSHRSQIVSRFCVQIKLINSHMESFAKKLEFFSSWKIYDIDFGWFIKKRENNSLINNLQRERRSARCSVAADDIGLVYRLIEARWREIDLIRKAFDKQCENIQSRNTGSVSERVPFSVTIPHINVDGRVSPQTITLDFAVVTERVLAKYVKLPHYLTKSPSPVFFLQYIGTRNKSDEWKAHSGHFAADAAEPPLLAMCRTGFFLSSKARVDLQLAEVSAFKQRANLFFEQHCFCLFAFKFRPDQNLARACFQRSIVLLPIREMHHGVAVGRAIARCEMRGARIGETMQQVFEPKSFELIRRDPVKVWSFWAKPKGRLAERYLISDKDVHAVMDVLRVMDANGWPLEKIKPASDLEQKCGYQYYIYQRNGTALKHHNMSCSLATVLWPYNLRSHDLRHAVVRYHYNNGVSLSALAILLHHKGGRELLNGVEDISDVTRMYATPTVTMQMSTPDYLATFEPSS